MAGLHYLCACIPHPRLTAAAVFTFVAFALRSVHTHAAAAVINFVTDSEDYDEDEEAAAEGDFQSPVARAFAPYSDLVLQKVSPERCRCAPPARVTLI